MCKVTVSSGGMLVTTLDPNDLNFENLRNFDGTTVYAQNKVYVSTYTTVLGIYNVQSLMTRERVTEEK